MKFGFFNGLPTSDFETHPSGYTRAYDADDFARFWAPFFSRDGVFPSSDNACKVSVLSGLTLKVAAGSAFVRGRRVDMDGTETVTVTGNCSIVLRMNNTVDVLGFQLLAVSTLMDTEVICDTELARVTVSGGTATVTDKRTFLSFAANPPYTPPDTVALPHIAWLYMLGLPLTAGEKAEVEGNATLMANLRKSVPVKLANRYAKISCAKSENAGSSNSTTVDNSFFATWDTIAFDNIGLGATLGGDVLTVPAGVEKIKVNTTAGVNILGPGYTASVDLYKNGALEVSSIASFSRLSSSMSSSESHRARGDAFLDVKGGDQIRIRARVSANGSFGSSYASVGQLEFILEVVK